MSQEPDASNAADETSLAVRRAVDGDLASLSWIVERLSPLLRLQAHYRLGPHLRQEVDPEDIVQETWLTAWPRLGELEAMHGRFTPALLRFLGMIVLYKANNLARKVARHATAVDPSPPTHADITAAQTGVVSGAVRRELQGVVHAALEELEETDREILVLRGIEQHRNQFVATLLGLTPQAVSMRYSRALEKLRRSLPGSVIEELADD